MTRAHDAPADTASHIGIPMTMREFDASIARYQAMLDACESADADGPNAHAAAAPGAEDYAAMVRLWNTIVFRRMAADAPALARFAASLFPRHAEAISRALAAAPTKGMALYSARHDLYIGGAPHANSQHRLIPDP